MPPFEEIRTWLFEAALPFWAKNGVDPRGGFYEELDLEGRPTAIAFKRTRVICRQIYVFSHASVLGWKEGLPVAAAGYEFLKKANVGATWASRLAPDGSVLDPVPHLYDLAFVLFALAWHHKASGDRDALTRAHALLDLLQSKMREPEGGFSHDRDPGGFRWQNPHMHLLEASLAMYDASGDQRFLNQATELVDLFRRRFFDGVTMAEYFDDNMQRASGEQGRRCEPGHHFEWAWILAQYQRLAAVDLSKEARALAAWAETNGVDPATQIAFNEVRDDGLVLDRASRTWPNTERIKAHVALFELGGHDPRAAIAGSARLLLDRYLLKAPRGLWIDLIDAEGQAVRKVSPASTFYHVFLAFAEILRLERALRSE